MNEIRHIYKQLLLIIEWYNDMSGNLKYLCMKLIDTDLRIRAGTAVKRRIKVTPSDLGTSHDHAKI